LKRGYFFADKLALDSQNSHAPIVCRFHALQAQERKPSSVYQNLSLKEIA
jgi:hypothetical protein